MMNPHLPMKGRIVKCITYSQDKKLFRIEANIDFIPGQFVEISIAGVGEFPVSICSAPHEKNFFEICVKKVGRATSYLFSMEEGAFIGYRGPFGNGFPIEKLKGEDILIIAGGIGILPLRSFIKEIIHEKDYGKIKILYGAKEPPAMLFRDELNEWRKKAEITEVFERGSEKQGLVSDVIAEVEIQGNEYALICGPNAMFNPVVKKLIEKGIEEERIFLSVERRMKCGIGKCGHCVFGGSYYTCTDGPVFSYADYKHAIL